VRYSIKVKITSQNGWRLNTKTNMATRKERASAQNTESALSKVYLKDSQAKYVETILKNQITFCHGPAGTSKTFSAMYAALKLYKEKKIKKIILTKPIQEAGEKLGFLPGTIDEKIAPYIKSFTSNIEKIVGFSEAHKIMGSGVIEFQPLAYMRGDTFDDAIMILDEAQNADYKQLMLFITRMGQDSKVVIAGDVSQYDIERSKVSLPAFIDLMKDVKGVGVHTFGDEDIVRAEILQEIVRRYEKWKHDNNK
jgi:phosphate starvation-inducible PhoH-like protein